MVKKGLVRKSRHKPARYSAAVTQDDVASGDLDLLMEKVSQGRVLPLVAHLMKDRSLSRQEVDELKQLIEDAEHQIKEQRENHDD